MRGPTEFVTDALVAESLSEEKSQARREEVINHINNADAMATRDLTIDVVEDTVSVGTVVWNDDVVRMKVDNGQLGNIEVIRPTDEDGVYIGFDLGSMMGAVGEVSEGEQYVYADEETLEEQMNLSLPEDDDNAKIRTAVEDGRAYQDGDTVFFETTVGVSELESLSSDIYKQDVNTEGLTIIVSYDVGEGRLERLAITVNNANSPDTHVFKEFLYDVEFSFEIPDSSDENVTEMGGGIMGGLGGGIGGSNPLGGSVDDVLNKTDSIMGGDDSPF